MDFKTTSFDKIYIVLYCSVRLFAVDISLLTHTGFVFYVCNGMESKINKKKLLHRITFYDRKNILYMGTNINSFEISYNV